MDPTELTLTLDLDRHLARHIGYDEDGEPIQEPADVEELIIGLAASKLVDRIVESRTYALNRDGDPVRALRDTIIGKAEELAAERVEEHVEAAFDQLIHETSEDGSQVFSHTLRDAIIKATQNATQVRERDKRGGPFGPGRTESAVERLLREHVEAKVEREVSDEIKSAKEKARAEVSQRASDAIAKALTK